MGDDAWEVCALPPYRERPVSGGDPDRPELFVDQRLGALLMVKYVNLYLFRVKREDTPRKLSGGLWVLLKREEEQLVALVEAILCEDVYC
jgi:hypothetical protein